MKKRTKRRCPHCADNGIRATLEPAISARGRVDRCWQCGGEYIGEKRVHPKTVRITECDTILDMQKDTAALKQLEELEELVVVPQERGGIYFSDWERKFIADVRRQHDDLLGFSDKQREKIKDIWQAADLRERVAPNEKNANLFSNLSPQRQAEQRERANRIKLPWEV
jgi:hypothetical protein